MISNKLPAILIISLCIFAVMCVVNLIATYLVGVPGFSAGEMSIVSLILANMVVRSS